MAHVNDNVVMHGVQGSVGKEVVYKKVNGKTIVSKYPDMSGVAYNRTQKKHQNRFAEAVAFACSVKKDPALKEEWEKKIAANEKLQGYSIYHAVLKETLSNASTKPAPHLVELLLRKCLESGEFNERQVKGLQYITAHGELTNAIYQRINGVSKSTATRDLQDLVKKQLMVCTGRGGGAVYKLLVSLDHNPAH